MATATVHVRGLKEFQAAVRRGDKALAKEIREELKHVGDVVVAEATSRGSRYAGIGAYKTAVRSRGIAVEQSKGKVTGLRGDFGSLQMRSVLEPALDAKEGEVVSGLEKAIDRVCDIVDG